MASFPRRLNLLWLWAMQSVCYVAALTYLFLGWPLGLFAGIGTAVFRVYVLGELFGSMRRNHLVSYHPRTCNAFTIFAAIIDAWLIVLSAWMFDLPWAKNLGLGAFSLLAPMILMLALSIAMAWLCGPRQSVPPAA